MRLFTQHLRLLVKLVAVGAILSIIVLFGHQLDYRWDMTADQIYSLSGQSIEVLDSLERSVTIYFFHTDQARSATEPERLRRLARRYAGQSAKVKFVEIDPNRRPKLTNKFKVSQNNSLVVKVGKKHQKLASYDLYNFKSRRSKQFRGEAALTEALLKLTAATDKTIFFARGFGEYSPTSRRKRSLSSWAAGLREEGFSVKTKNILAADLPDTSNLLAVIAPRRSYSEKILTRLKKWSRRGGKILFALGPTIGAEFNPFFKLLGIKYIPENIIDPARRSVQSLMNPFVFMPKLGSHPAVKKLRDRNLAVQVGRSGRLKVSADTVQNVLKTSGRAYAKPMPPAGQKLRVEFNPDKDSRGPFSIAATADLGRGKVFVATTARLFGNSLYNSSPGNKNFALNLVNWLLDREVSLSIRPTPLNYNRVQVTAYQAYVIQIIALLGVPGLIIIWGGFVWWKRKNR